MIIDKLENFNRYNSVHPLFNMVLNVLNNFKNIEFGKEKIMIKEEDLYVIPFKPGNSNAINPKLEIHRKYIDIHFIISGTETCGWKPGENCSSPEGDFNYKDDYILFADLDYQRIVLQEKSFIIFFPGEAHVPCIETKELQKFILKVKAG